MAPGSNSRDWPYVPQSLTPAVSVKCVAARVETGRTSDSHSRPRSPLNALAGSTPASRDRLTGEAPLFLGSVGTVLTPTRDMKV